MPPRSQNSPASSALQKIKAIQKDPILAEALRRQVWSIHKGFLREAARTRHAASFYAFVVDAWHVLEPGRPMKTGWLLKALCAALEAVTDGRETYLLMNLPPGTMKSLLLNVFWPAWEWGARNLAHLKYLGVAFKQGLARRDGRKMRRLVESRWYQELYGDRVRLVTHADDLFENSRGGFRKSCSVDSVTGDRADRVLVDDPHNASEAESETRRSSTVGNVTENVLNRVNDADTSAIVIIMQRVHEKDLSGEIVRRDLGFTHICLPMLFDPGRCCVTGVLTDPRTEPGELLFPELISAAGVERYMKRMGEYAFSAQCQQSPISREGHWFKRGKLVLTDHAPPKMKRYVICWDLAATQPTPGKDPDWTVALYGGIDDESRIWILGMYRFRKSAGETEERIVSIVDIHGSDVLHVFPLEPAQAGKHQESTLRRRLSNHYKLKFERPTKTKMARAHDAMVAVDLRRVNVCDFPDRNDFVNEVCAVPACAHDDIVDAFADLVRELQTGSTYSLDGIRNWGG